MDSSAQKWSSRATTNTGSFGDSLIHGSETNEDEISSGRDSMESEEDNDNFGSRPALVRRDSLEHPIYTNANLESMEVSSKMSSTYAKAGVDITAQARHLFRVLAPLRPAADQEASWNAGQPTVRVASIVSQLAQSGIIADKDPRFKKLASIAPTSELTPRQFSALLLKLNQSHPNSIVQKALSGDLTVPDWPGFRKKIEKIYEDCRKKLVDKTRSTSPLWLMPKTAGASP